MKRIPFFFILIVTTSLFIPYTLSPQSPKCIVSAISATVNGNRFFKSCDADAHSVLSWLNFYGTSDRDIIGFNFTGSPKQIVPGTYKIIKAGETTPDQKWNVNAVYYLNGSTVKKQYQSIIGSITITVADGKHYKGTFQMDVQQIDTKEILHITNGKFDLEYHEVSNRKLKVQK